MHKLGIFNVKCGIFWNFQQQFFFVEGQNLWKYTLSRVTPMVQCVKFTFDVYLTLMCYFTRCIVTWHYLFANLKFFTTSVCDNVIIPRAESVNLYITKCALNRWFNPTYKYAKSCSVPIHEIYIQNVCST